MKTTLVLALTLILGLTAATAQAQVIGHQKARIAQGVRSGELNRKETKHLMREERKFRRHKHRAYANDGKIGPRERRALKFEKRKISRETYRFKHNRF